MNNKLILLGSIFITLMFFSSSFGSAITYTYDNLNRLTRVAYENGITEEFIYDAAGNRITYTVNSVGTIQVNPEPNEANGSWTLTGPNGYSQSGTGDQQISNLATGSYSITWNDITDWIKPTPSTETKSLASGDSITFTGIYSEIGGSISGVVTRDFDNQPVSGVQVHANDYLTGNWGGGALTQAYGSYIITGLPAGSYKVCVDTAFTYYTFECYNNATNYNNATAVTVTSGLTTSGIDFSLATPNDTTPDQFTFTDQTNVALSTVITSNTITVSGINAAAAISITGGTYSINGGAYTSSGGTVSNGNTVTLRQTSSGSYSTTTNATLTIGGVSDTFTVRTLTDPQKKMTGLPWLQLLLGD